MKKLRQEFRFMLAELGFELTPEESEEYLMAFVASMASIKSGRSAKQTQDYILECNKKLDKIIIEKLIAAVAKR